MLSLTKSILQLKSILLQTKSRMKGVPLIAWAMEPIVTALREWVLTLAKTAAASPQPFGLIELFGLVVKCLAGEQTHVAWQERPVTAAAMVIVGSGSGLAIIATETEKQSVLVGVQGAHGFAWYIEISF